MKSMKFVISLVAVLTLSVLGPTAYADDDDDDNPFKFTATATGAQEVIETFVTSTGRVQARFDRGLTEVKIRVRLRGINSMVRAAHFHCARAGQNGPPAFGLLSPGPLTEINKNVRVTLTNADFTGADCESVIGRPVNNIAALFGAMRDGLIYFNVHTADFPPGEIRGQMLERD